MKFIFIVLGILLIMKLNSAYVEHRSERNNLEQRSNYFHFKTKPKPTWSTRTKSTKKMMILIFNIISNHQLLKYLQERQYDKIQLQNYQFQQQPQKVL